MIFFKWDTLWKIYSFPHSFLLNLFEAKLQKRDIFHSIFIWHKLFIDTQLFISNYKPKKRIYLFQEIVM